MSNATLPGVVFVISLLLRDDFFPLQFPDLLTSLCIHYISSQMLYMTILGMIDSITYLYIM